MLIDAEPIQIWRQETGSLPPGGQQLQGDNRHEHRQQNPLKPQAPALRFSIASPQRQGKPRQDDLAKKNDLAQQVLVQVVGHQKCGQQHQNKG